MIKIPLTQGKVALIDDKNFERLSKFKWYANKIGKIFYAVTTVKLNNKRIYFYMHRLILNAKQHELTDHRDGDGLNNQKDNIRKCTNSQNQMNSKSNTGSSKYKGVHWHKRDKKWVSRITINDKRKHLGYFDNEKMAAYRYNEFAKKFFGEFVQINLIRKGVK